MTTRRRVPTVNEDSRKRPIRTETIHLDGDYEGTWVSMRVNPPLRIYDQLGEDVRGGLGAIVQGWNLVDEQGKPVTLDATLSGATDEELRAIAQAFVEVMRNRVTLPN